MAYPSIYREFFIKKRKTFVFSDKGFYGAGDEARTRYLHLGKVALYRMSYARINRMYYSRYFEFVNTFFRKFERKSDGFFSRRILLFKELHKQGRKNNPKYSLPFPHLSSVGIRQTDAHEASRYGSTGPHPE